MKNHFFRALSEAFTIKKNPFPWMRGLCAGICMATPILIGLLLGSFQYGLLAGIGGFAYLYVWNEPYPQRAKKIFFVVLGLGASIGLGILTSPSPLAFAIMIGVIGAVGTFIFGALKIPGPASIFFVIVFATTSASQTAPSEIPLRVGLILLGGAFSWLVAMIGWFFNPHGPEESAIKKLYSELAALLHSLGTEQFQLARERTLIALKGADATLLAGYVSWKSSITFKRLYLLKEQANAILSDILEMYAQGRTNLPPEIEEKVLALANSLDSKKNRKSVKILQPEECDQEVARLLSKIYDADAILNEPISKINQEINITKRKITTIFWDLIDKNSIVFISSIKYGVVLMIATLIAFGFEFERSYWIPVSCGAVMLGSTIMSTFHRSIQRAIGTIVGIIIAAIILSIQPTGILVALFIFILASLTELVIVRNYAFAVMFITPTSLLMAESTTQIHNLSYFATARIIDVLIGIVIGLLGVLLIGRKSASSRVPHLMTKTIRSQSQLLFSLFSGHKKSMTLEVSQLQNKMRTNLTNLKTVYTTALGEIPSNKKTLEFLWPVIFSIEQLGYLLDTSAKSTQRPHLSKENLAQLLFVFETMATPVNDDDLSVPEIKGFSKIQKEIIALQEAIRRYHGQNS